MPIYNYGQLPALDVKPAFDPYAATEHAQTYLEDQNTLNQRNQIKENELSLTQSAQGNSMLSQAATEALAANPEDAPKIWDQEMGKLAESGVKGASQYIGHFRPDLAEHVVSAFSGGAAKANAGQAASQVNPQMQAALAQVPAETLQTSLAHANQAIEGFNNVHDAASWAQELQALKDSGLPVDQFIPDQTWNYTNYQAAYKAIQKLATQRDAIQGELTNRAFGLPSVGPQEKPVVVGHSLVTPEGKVLYSEPQDVKGRFQIITPDKTGTDQAVIFDTGKGTYSVAGGGQGAQQSNLMPQLTDELIQSESGGNPNAQNPQPGQTSGGIGGMTDATYVTQARKLVPALANATDAQIIQMKKNGQLNGLNRDLVTAQNQDNLQGLKSNGLPTTSDAVATAYKLGLPDAKKVLTAPENTKLADVLPKQVMDANPQFKDQTVGQYRLNMRKQFGTEEMAQQSPFGSGNQSFPMDPESSDILGHTGLSIPAFKVLVGQQSQLPRGHERTVAMNDAQKFLSTNGKGVDLSTFSSEYEANNKSLQFNIQRFNQTNAMEKEVLGTLANLDPVAKQALTRLTPANAALIFGGKLTSDPLVNQYAWYLNQLRSEVAGYLAATQGKGTGATGSGGSGNAVQFFNDEAAQFITNGIATGGLNGLARAVLDSTDKMNNVMQYSIDQTRKNIWDMFGVGDQFKPRYPQASAGVAQVEQEARSRTAGLEPGGAPAAALAPTKGWGKATVVGQ